MTVPVALLWTKTTSAQFPEMQSVGYCPEKCQKWFSSETGFGNSSHCLSFLELYGTLYRNCVHYRIHAHCRLCATFREEEFLALLHPVLVKLSPAGNSWVLCTDHCCRTRGNHSEQSKFFPLGTCLLGGRHAVGGKACFKKTKESKE